MPAFAHKPKPARKERPVIRAQAAAGGNSIVEAIEAHPRCTMTVAEYAAIIGKTPKAVYDAINRGNIPTVQIPGIRSKVLEPRTLSKWLRTHNAAFNL